MLVQREWPWNRLGKGAGDPLPFMERNSPGSDFSVHFFTPPSIWVIDRAFLHIII